MNVRKRKGARKPQSHMHVEKQVPITYSDTIIFFFIFFRDKKQNEIGWRKKPTTWLTMNGNFSQLETTFEQQISNSTHWNQYQSEKFAMPRTKRIVSNTLQYVLTDLFLELRQNLSQQDTLSYISLASQAFKWAY